ncbi:MAG: xylose isomerase [Burkholderiales bacterium]|nr:xylose isomerase [Burkholderiales bacterium]
MLDGISLGCNGRGVQHIAGTPITVDEQFRLLKSAGIFDHFDRMPQPGQEREYVDAANRHGVPIRTGLWSYTIGKDEAQLEKNLRVCKDAGGEFHDIMPLTRHAAGHVVTDREALEFYLHAHEVAQKVGIGIGFEVHIYMFTEDFRRVMPLARAVRERGVPFNFILDHSHVLLKVENPEEQDVSGIREDVEAGRCIIDPYEEGNVLDEWIAEDMIPWLQVRPVSPAGPKNRWALTADGHWGRACQYPFVKPRPGEWHSSWHAWRVEPCKEVVRRVFRRHLTHAATSPLRYLTTDMIDMPDYGDGARYSLFEQNVAIAQWLRKTYAEIKADVARD